MNKSKRAEDKPSESRYARKVRARKRYLKQEGHTIEGWREGRERGTIEV